MPINIQPIEKAVRRSTNGALEVHSIFGPTIQGEGPNCGQPAVFVRLAGCNLQCPACDTDYTSQRSTMSTGQILQNVDFMASNCYDPLVVISGGEPFRQDISPLCYVLMAAGYRVQVETNGTLPTPDFWPSAVQIVVSPKAGKVNPDLLGKVTAWKYVLDADHVDPTDGLPTTALNHPASPRVARPPAEWPRSKIYVQPMDPGYHDGGRNMQAVVDSCLKHGYTVQLQIHKILNLE